MTPITNLVERLRGSVPEKYPGFRNLNIEAASMLETLWAEVEAWRAASKNARPVTQFDGDVWDGVRAATRSTDAELGRITK